MTSLEQVFNRKSTSAVKTSGYLYPKLLTTNNGRRRGEPYLEVKREKTSFKMLSLVNWNLILASAALFKAWMPNYAFK